MAERDTIFAVASGAAKAAISVVRVSGPRAHDLCRAVAGRLPVPRVATLARLRDPAGGETLDHALVLVFDAARSEVGEDGVEFHLHGSPAVVHAVIAVLSRQPGLRPAEPGEFARRAFANGRMDLVQVEALADLIDAETDWQRKQAQRHLSGAMKDATAPWREALVSAAADIETAIDFAEDVALADALHDRIAAHVAPVRAGLARELARGRAAERVRSGVQIVIAGPPNAGKSTLLNTLVQRDAAIVSTIAGTTRDPIEVHLDLGGCPVTLVDTAGLRESADPVEQIGVTLAQARADAADLVLWLADDGSPPPPFAAPVWRLAGQSDRRAAPEGDAFPLSAVTGHNIDRLLERLTRHVHGLAAGGASGLLARERHRVAFATAAAALDHALGDAGLPVEILAEDLRVALTALERLIGSVDADDVLGAIFSRFCIGK